METTSRKSVRTWTKAARWLGLFLPWEGRASRFDILLMASFGAVVALGLLLKPLQPFLIASHPVWLTFLTGDLIAIGAAAAFARIGEAQLWLVVIAGGLGMVKFDWLMWWAGRRWGHRMIMMVSSPGQADRWSKRMQDADPRLVGVMVVLAVLPGIPTAIIYALAGRSGMRLRTFLLLDLLGALSMTGLVAGLGYGAGRSAVDVVLTIDRYASLISLSVIMVAMLLPAAKHLLRRVRRLPLLRRRTDDDSEANPGRDGLRSDTTDALLDTQPSALASCQLDHSSCRSCASSTSTQMS